MHTPNETGPAGADGVDDGRLGEAAPAEARELIDVAHQALAWVAAAPERELRAAWNRGWQRGRDAGQREAAARIAVLEAELAAAERAAAGQDP